jgi:TolA-binding protein
MHRQHRRELKHDKFVDELGTLSSRARENQRVLITITVAAVALAVIVYGIYFWRSNREHKAQDALADAISTMDSPLIPPPGGQAQPGAKFKTEKERNDAAAKQFQDIVGKFSGSDAADVAGLYLARFDAAKGDNASAKKFLQQFVSDHPKHFLVGSARYSLYQLRIEGGEAPQVVTDVQAQLAKPSDETLLPPDTLIVVLAHAYDAEGQTDKSRDMYRRIATEFPDSPYALEAQRKIGAAGAGSGMGGLNLGGM